MTNYIQPTLRRHRLTFDITSISIIISCLPYNVVFVRNGDELWSSRTSFFTSGGRPRPVTIDLLNLLVFRQPGVVAHACNPVTWRLGSLNGLRAGFLGVVVLCRSVVRAKFGVNMVNTEESEFSRLVKEE